ncbi:MAG TPA: T9SS type A sorting domain-containing protein [Flavipsychrobacter sp.]|nr:T9SS type A sorting domain-containing protein [Flavipsychrobacter sp.]
MKNTIITLLISLAAGSNVMAEDHPISCPTVTLEGTLSTRTLYSDTTYLLSGCVSVPDNVTITFQQGVRVLGQKSTNGTLVFRKGSIFTSQGTSSDPILFSSDQTIGNKAPGDWGGLIFEGDAPNNNSNSITLTNRTCTSVTGGGSTSNANSGVLKYLRIEYAQYGLTMLSVGSGTEMHDIQIADCAQNGLELYGGTVNFNRLFFLNNRGIDILATQGNVSKAQYILTLRLDLNAYVTTGLQANSIVFSNNDDAVNNYLGSTSALFTHPVFSNVTIIGPRYCGGTGLTYFKNAVLYQHRTEGTIANSVIAGWPTGLFMADQYTADKADISYKLNFFENSFYNNAVDYDLDVSVTWPNNCALDMDTWISDGGGFSCSQPNNQFSSPSYDPDFSNSICSDYSMYTPSFLLGASTELLTADFPAESDLDDAFFVTSASYHGAFTKSTDWTDIGWVNWYPAGEDFCPENRKIVATGIANTASEKSNLTLAPNPANGITYASFTTSQAGAVQISITNSLGQVVRTINQSLDKGDQRIAITVDGLSAGLYLVNVSLEKGNISRTKMVIK